MVLQFRYYQYVDMRESVSAWSSSTQTQVNVKAPSIFDY